MKLIKSQPRFRCEFGGNEKVIWVTSIPFGSMMVEVEKVGIDKTFGIIGRKITL